MIYFISDTHFDHTNIIKYCDRPFSSTEEMNNHMLERWNSTVSKDDIVFFLGDLTFGRGRRHIDYWLGQLNGRIEFVKGSHDTEKSGWVVMREYNILLAEPYKFYLVHDSLDVPCDWTGWVIHGHHHNYCPFMDRRHKRFNVSVEVIDYTPVSLDRILEEIVKS